MLVLILKSCWLSLDFILGLKIKLMFIKLKIEHHETVVGSIYKKIILKWGNGTLFGFNSQPVCIVKNEKQI